MRTAFFTFFVALALCLNSAATSLGEPERMFVFNSDGGAARIAHVKDEPVRNVVCFELNEMEGTAVTDFFWCPIVGGNVFIYPTNVGERMGDNIRDWDKVHPYYREQGRAMADNLAELIKGGDDPVDMLVERAKELGIRFWLTWRMNEIHEDDDRFMVVRSLFKEKHLDWLHGKDHHPEASSSVALTIARMPAFTASGRSGQRFKTAHKSGSIGVLPAPTAVPTAAPFSEPLFSSGSSAYSN